MSKRVVLLIYFAGSQFMVARLLLSSVWGLLLLSSSASALGWEEIVVEKHTILFSRSANGTLEECVAYDLDDEKSANEALETLRNQKGLDDKALYFNVKKERNKYKTVRWKPPIPVNAPPPQIFPEGLKFDPPNKYDVIGKSGKATVGNSKVYFEFHTNNKFATAGDMRVVGRWSQKGVAVTIDLGSSTLHGIVDEYGGKGSRVWRDEKVQVHHEKWSVDFDYLEIPRPVQIGQASRIAALTDTVWIHENDVKNGPIVTSIYIFRKSNGVEVVKVDQSTKTTGEYTGTWKIEGDFIQLAMKDKNGKTSDVRLKYDGARLWDGQLELRKK